AGVAEVGHDAVRQTLSDAQLLAQTVGDGALAESGIGDGGSEIVLARESEIRLAADGDVHAGLVRHLNDRLAIAGVHAVDRAHVDRLAIGTFPGAELLSHYGDSLIDVDVSDESEDSRFWTVGFGVEGSEIVDRVSRDLGPTFSEGTRVI